MNNYHKYDTIAPRIRAQVNKVKYGSAQPIMLAQLLEREAQAIRRDIAIEHNQTQQERFDVI